MARTQPWHLLTTAARTRARYLEDDKRYDDVLNAPHDMALSKYEHKP